MNIIKHIFCVSFALTAWNAYGMQIAAKAQDSKQTTSTNVFENHMHIDIFREFDQAVTLKAMQISNPEDQAYFLAQVYSARNHKILMKENNTQHAAFVILSDTQSPADLAHAETIKKPAKAHQTSPVKTVSKSNRFTTPSNPKIARTLFPEDYDISDDEMLELQNSFTNNLSDITNL